MMMLYINSDPRDSSLCFFSCKIPRASVQLHIRPPPLHRRPDHQPPRAWYATHSLCHTVLHALPRATSRRLPPAQLLPRLALSGRGGSIGVEDLHLGSTTACLVDVHEKCCCCTLNTGARSNKGEAIREKRT
nr:uncharacterized protein LOC109783983 [Aegilops tauschii subsp. strangulata]